MNNFAKLRILYIGCVASSAHILKYMIAHNVIPVGVITMEKSNYNSDYVDLAPICVRNGISCKYVKNVNDIESLEYIKACCPDVIYCFGISQLLKADILNIPRLGCIGFHPAELPNNKGRHPIIWALVLGLKETASSFFLMDEKADNGGIVSQEKIKIDVCDTAASLYKKIIDKASVQVIKFTKEIMTQGIVVKKNNDGGNVWRKRSKKDGVIDWRMSCEAIYNLVRALSYPYPGAVFIKDDKDYVVRKVVTLNETGYDNIEPGKIIKVNSQTNYIVKCYDGLIHVLESDSVNLFEGEYL